MFPGLWRGVTGRLVPVYRYNVGCQLPLQTASYLKRRKFWDL